MMLLDKDSGAKLCKRLRNRFTHMQAIRQPFETSWKEIIALIRPDLALWDDYGISQQGKKRGLDVYSASPIHNLLIWRDGLLGRIASPGLDWFYEKMARQKQNDLEGVKNWLQECDEELRDLMKNSNYYSHLGLIMLDGGSIGNAPGWIENSVDKYKTGIACDNFHPREIYIEENSQGIANAWARGPFEYSALQAKEKFGEENLSESIKRSLEENANALTRYRFIHMCLPDTDPVFSGIKGLPKGPWISVYFEENPRVDGDTPNSVSRYNGKRFTYWRMFETPGSVYSLGLASFALIDIFGLNQITRSMLRAAHLAVEPAVHAPIEMRGRVHIIPGGRMWGTPDSKPQIVYDGGKYPYGADMLDRQSAVMRRWFDVDFFTRNIQAEKVFSATHDLQVEQEFALLIGPKIGRLQTDKLSQDLEIIFELAEEMGRLPPPPQSLLDASDGRIDVVFNGILDRAQRDYEQIKQFEVTMNKFERVLSVYPGERHRLDSGKLTKRLLRESEAIREEEIRSDDEVEAIQQAQLEQQQAMQMADMAERAAKVAPGLGKKVEEGSPMAAMAGAET